ncbi:MAG: hypothetical protein KDA75_09715 [Planctomycetaceae bacterium]|nr:hypothetical protein [Planctomycetaceae bacterium]
MRRSLGSINRQAARRLETRRRDSDRRPRRGAALIVVMICLLGIAMLAGSLLRLAVAQHRQARMQHRQLQAEWLAAAGIERALTRLSADQEWSSEAWTVPDELIGTTARVSLTIESGSVSNRKIVSVATIGPETSGHVRVTLRRSVPSAAASAQEEAP